MSDYQLSPKPRVIGKRSRIAVVVSRFNSAFTDALLEHCLKELLVLEPDAVVDVIQVPGAFEIPYAVECIAHNTQPDVIIALGLILRGATSHGDLVANSVTDALMTTSVYRLIPVIHEVLLVANEKEAEERTMGQQLNRGREAARAAIGMLATIDTLKKTKAHNKAGRQQSYG